MEKITDTEVFMALLKAAVSRSDITVGSLDKQQWSRILAIAKKQSMIGVVTPVVEKLSERGELPFGVSSMWSLTTEKIKERSALTLKVARSVCGVINGDGLRCCILKGPGVAALYPEPDLRQSGDLDIWVEGGVDKVLSYLHTKGKVGEVFYHHCDVGKSGSVPIEIHFTPIWFNNFPRNKRLQQYFRKEADAQFGNFDEKLGFSVTTPVLTAFLGLLHILRHVLFEGVGLRQVMDFYYILTTLKPEEREETSALMREYGLGKFTSALMHVEQQVFGLEEDKMLCAPDQRLGRKLLDEIMIAGNFGRFDTRNEIKKDDSLLKRAVLRTRRLLRYFNLSPSEVLWAPVFKTWQYFWRMRLGT